MAMHANLTGGTAHYYRVTANNAEGTGAPSDTRGITTRTPRNPSAPTEPVAVPLSVHDGARVNAITNTIELYWLDPTSTGGHPLGPHLIEVKRRGRNSADTGWASWPTSWTAFTHNGTNYDLMIGPTDGVDDYTVAGATASDVTDPTVEDDGSITTGAGEAFNLVISSGPSDSTKQYQYMFRMKAKQSGAGARGLNLESGWVNFNQRPRAGRGYIEVPVLPARAPDTPTDDDDDDITEIPLQPTLKGRALFAEAVKDQGIGLTWDPSDGTDNMAGVNDNNTPDNSTDDFNDDGPAPSDYRVDVSTDGVTWKQAQTRTVSLRKWDDEGLGSTEIRYYRLFPINHGQFGQAAIAGAQARPAVIASPDATLNLRQTDATTTSITMSWDPLAAAAAYNLYSAPVNEVTGLAGVWASLKSDVTDMSYTDSKDLKPGDSRWYRVVALDDKKVALPGADGAEALGETDDAGEPGVPIGLVAQQAFDSSLTNSDDRGVLLLWARPVDRSKDPTTSYTVEWKSDTMTGNAWETLVTDTTNLDNQTPKSTHYHHEEPELGTDEQRAYRVSALSGGGAGMASNVSYYPPMTMPPAAAELKAPTMLNVVYDDEDPDDIKVRVSWEDGDNAVGHLVMLFTSDFVGDPQVDATPTGSMSEFDVSDGSYIAVVVSYDAVPNIELEISDVVPAGN